ncbi:hypothetical protein VB773_01610 [Haloarculaceae archaeon H-GB2-1]|nr:hypothetical protein [Haloarculaceae archaeon H-GB1-1]MEA5406405.1 hypothetical protein [Haloarculaceae archaeon H-GB2-1]
MSLSALDSIDDALQATKGLLLPFDRAIWLRLAVVMFFVGGGGGFSFPNTSNFGGSDFGNGGGVGGTPSGQVQPPEFTPELMGLIAGFALVVLLIVLVLAVLGGIMEFVFVESLGTEEVRLKQYVSENWGRGLRLFGFRIGFGLLNLLVVVAVLAAIAAATVGFSPEQWTPGGLIGVVLLAIPFLILDALVAGTITGFTTMFVVPIMLLEERGVLSAWRRFWPTLKTEWKEYVSYGIMAFILNIVTAIAQGIIGFVLVLVVTIPFAVVGFGLYFALGGANGVGVIVGSVILVLAVLFVLVVIVLSLLVKVPFQSFLRYYALFVLGDTNDSFDAVAEVRSSVRAD